MQLKSAILAGRDDFLSRPPTPSPGGRELLRAGKLVAFPTETVYGLGADARNERCRARDLRGQGPSGRPSGDRARARTRPTRRPGRARCPRGARVLADAFWPGPLTLIVPRAPHVSDAVTGGQDSVGLRVPSHPVAQALLRAFAAAGGRGIAAPSANRFGRISPTTAQHVRDDLGDDVAMIVDGGACEVGIESTIVAFAGDEPVLLRPGGIARGGPRARARRGAARGRIATRRAPRERSLPHYAPRTPSRLVSARRARRPLRCVAVLARTVAPQGVARWIAAPPDAIGYAHDLYANLRALDAMGAAEILIEDVPASDGMERRARSPRARDARRRRRPD